MTWGKAARHQSVPKHTTYSLVAAGASTAGGMSVEPHPHIIPLVGRKVVTYPPPLVSQIGLNVLAGDQGSRVTPQTPHLLNTGRVVPKASVPHSNAEGAGELIEPQVDGFMLLTEGGE